MAKYMFDVDYRYLKLYNKTHFQLTCNCVVRTDYQCHEIYQRHAIIHNYFSWHFVRLFKFRLGKVK